MKNKFLIVGGIVIAFLLAGGGVFFWQQNQAAVAPLNAILPEGVRVVKSIFGNEYRVVNKIDGYEFEVPRAWVGLQEIAYTPTEKIESYSASTIELIGNQGSSRLAIINKFLEEDLSISLRQWAEQNFRSFGLVGEFNNDRVNNIELVKTQENIHLGGLHIYFFRQNSGIYTLTNASEDYIKEIIVNGKW